MSKFTALMRLPMFWISFIASTIAIIAIETFLLSFWALPIIGYRVSYMGEISAYDLIFIWIFALIFGFGTALFIVARQCKAGSCTLGTSGGILAFFTLLCPICPIFFLTFFGLSATVISFVPYFWPLRILALILILIGTFLLYRNIDTKSIPKSKINKHVIFQMTLTTIIVLLLISNQALALQIGKSMLGPQPGDPIELSGDFAKDIGTLVTPSSLPFYGPELGLDFSSLENINNSIQKMAIMAPKQGRNALVLTDEEMKRYVKIGTQTTLACEFCCSAKTLVREDGSPTCGCAHSKAMRGMAAYLIKNHPDITNEEISYEIARQKGLYFPTQMQKRMASQLSGDPSAFTPDIKYLTKNLSSAELSRLQSAARESGFQPTDAPKMVGGC